MIFLLLAFFGVLCSAHVGKRVTTFGSLTTPYNSSTFVNEPLLGISGLLTQWDQGPIPQLATCGDGFTILLGYTMINQTLPTTLTYAFALRDATKMPVATLTNLFTTVLAGTCMASATSGIIHVGSTIKTGGTSKTVKCNYAVGSLDSYGNIIGQGDDIFLDFGIYFSTPVAAQNATCIAYAQSDLWNII